MKDKNKKQKSNKQKPKVRFGTVNYPVGDFLINVKNAAMAKNKNILVRHSKQIFAVAQALQKLGYFDNIEKDGESMKVSLAFESKKPIITNLRLVSKPGLRIYLRVADIEKKRGPSTFLVSSPKGVISSKEVKKLRVSGEVIAEIW